MPEFISDRHHAANVFLSHYHYRTQPCDPFKVDWRRRQATPFAEMKTDEIHFLKKTAELVEQRSKFENFRENKMPLTQVNRQGKNFVRQGIIGCTRTSCTLSLKCSKRIGRRKTVLLILTVEQSIMYLSASMVSRGRTILCTGTEYCSKKFHVPQR